MDTANLGGLLGRGGHRVGWHLWREPELCGSVTVATADSHVVLAPLSRAKRTCRSLPGCQLEEEAQG